MNLKYMAKNKLQARATGPVTLLTRQPTEGKSKKGGLKFSEMEHEVLAAHGASILLREMYSSDDTTIYVCEKCGSLAVEDNIRNRVHCPICGETEKISKVKVSYAFHLLLNELISLGIWPKLKLDYKF
jgi:DNA-directed RNA polymerase beta subunit